jgi:hypothetical protein
LRTKWTFWYFWESLWRYHFVRIGPSQSDLSSMYLLTLKGKGLFYILYSKRRYCCLKRVCLSPGKNYLPILWEWAKSTERQTHYSIFTLFLTLFWVEYDPGLPDGSMFISKIPILIYFGSPWILIYFWTFNLNSKHTF